MGDIRSHKERCRLFGCCNVWASGKDDGSSERLGCVVFVVLVAVLCCIHVGHQTLSLEAYRQVSTVSTKTCPARLLHMMSRRATVLLHARWCRGCPPGGSVMRKNTVRYRRRRASMTQGPTPKNLSEAARAAATCVLCHGGQLRARRTLKLPVSALAILHSSLFFPCSSLSPSSPNCLAESTATTPPSAAPPHPRRTSRPRRRHVCSTPTASRGQEAPHRRHDLGR